MHHVLKTNLIEQERKKKHFTSNNKTIYLFIYATFCPWFLLNVNGFTIEKHQQKKTKYEKDSNERKTEEPNEEWRMETMQLINSINNNIMIIWLFPPNQTKLNENPN